MHKEKWLTQQLYIAGMPLYRTPAQYNIGIQVVVRTSHPHLPTALSRSSPDSLVGPHRIHGEQSDGMPATEPKTAKFVQSTENCTQIFKKNNRRKKKT
jgi:hypothetical protein